MTMYGQAHEYVITCHRLIRLPMASFSRDSRNPY